MPFPEIRRFDNSDHLRWDAPRVIPHPCYDPRDAVRPGVIDTEIHASGGVPDRAERVGKKAPLGRAGRPDEFANAIVWLLSPEASYVTGSILDVSGGR